MSSYFQLRFYLTSLGYGGHNFIQGKSRDKDDIWLRFSQYSGQDLQCRLAEFIIEEMENNCPNRKRHPVLRREKQETSDCQLDSS